MNNDFEIELSKNSDCGDRPCVVLVYPRLVVTNHGLVAIGGAETYLLELAILARNEGFRVALIQFEGQMQSFVHDGIEVISLGWSPNLFQRHPTRRFAQALKRFDRASTLVIYGSEAAVTRLPGIKTILIQHGIGFDYPAAGRTLGKLSHLKKTSFAQWLVRMEALRAAKLVNKIVCVDYVYPTWFKTYNTNPTDDLHTITNFARLPIKANTRTNFNRVLFARRFEERRGANIMVDAALTLLRAAPNIEFTFAGSGPLRLQMEDAFQNEPRVRFTTYDRSESVNIHQRHDIAVIPSLASEGTSFSLLEAMAAGCAVVTTPVGGLMNIILDGYNGLVCSPSGKSIANAVLKVHTDFKLAAGLSKRAQQTVRYSFSYSKWRGSWLSLLKQMFDS
jgi:glycosyltransferase involved in cell wall biosynthesis